MILTQPLEITTPEGKATGRWRLVEMSDEHDGAEPLCECGGRSSDNPATCGHESPAAATECEVASATVRARRGERIAAQPRPLLAYGSDNGGGVHLHLGDAVTRLSHDEAHDLAAGLVREANRPNSPARSRVADLARVAFDAYGASTGGKTWDGKDIPPFETIRERTPHVAAAWEAAVVAVLNKLESAR